MTDTVDLGPQARVIVRLAEQVTDEQLGEPTPCPEYAVRHLLGHFVGLATGFRDAGRKDLGPTTDTAPSSFVPVAGPDWRGALPKALDELAETWRDPLAWSGDTRAGGVPLPGAVAGLIALNELVVHGWDLARATGQDYTPDPGSLQAAHTLLASWTDQPRSGTFGPVVPVPDGSALLDRVVGLSGRDPGWAPGGQA